MDKDKGSPSLTLLPTSLLPKVSPKTLEHLGPPPSDKVSHDSDNNLLLTIEAWQLVFLLPLVLGVLIFKN